MSFQKSTAELKEEVLTICGELTDGTSPFDANAVQYLNDLYQGLLSGGNEFGIDTAEPWTWAQAKRPMPLELVVPYSGAATLTQNSFSGTFSAAPTISLRGRYLRVESRADYYKITKHVANTTAFELDQKYLADGGTLNVLAIKLDYDLIDELIVIDEANSKIDFREDISTDLTATILSGSYLPDDLCVAVKIALELVGAETYTVSFNQLTRKFVIAHGGAHLDLLFASGPNASISASLPLGYDISDYTDDTTYTSAYSQSGIMRLTKPITMYRESPTYYNSPKDVGKIFMIDDNTFLREYPLNRLVQSVPEKFCPIEMGTSGLWRIRFNGYVIDESIRAEVNYIPVTRKLVDNAVSIPVVPGSYSKYLVYGAAHFLLLDKSDNKADQYRALAMAKLQAMVNDARKNSSLAGNNFGKLIPRLGSDRIWGYKR